MEIYDIGSGIFAHTNKMEIWWIQNTLQKANQDTE